MTDFEERCRSTLPALRSTLHPRARVARGTRRAESAGGSTSPSASIMSSGCWIWRTRRRRDGAVRACPGQHADASGAGRSCCGSGERVARAGRGELFRGFVVYSWRGRARHLSGWAVSAEAVRVECGRAGRWAARGHRSRGRGRRAQLPLGVRNRRPGDRFRPLGAPGQSEAAGLPGRSESPPGRPGHAAARGRRAATGLSGSSGSRWRRTFASPTLHKA